MKTITLTSLWCIMNGADLPNLLTAQRESCSGQSSASSRRHAAVYRHWSSSSSAPASVSGHFLVLSQVSNQFRTTTKHSRETCLQMQGCQQDRKLGVCLGSPVCYCWTYPKEALVCTMCPSGCVCQLTPAELAHRVSRFGQTAKQHLLPVGVGRLSQLVLWQTEGEMEKKHQGDRETRWLMACWRAG